MRKTFYRVVALALVPALVLADPALASGFSNTFSQKSPSVYSDFSRQALTARLINAFTGSSLAIAYRQTAGTVSRRRFIAGGAAALALVQIPAPQKQEVPLAPTPELLKQEKGLAQAPAYTNLWHQGFGIPPTIDQLEDFIEPVIDNSSSLSAQWDETTASIADWFAAGAPLKLLTFGTDQSRAVRIDTNGPGYEDAVLYPREINLNPFKRFDSASVPPADERFWHKTFRIWKDLVFNGGFSTVPKAVIEKNLTRVSMAGTQIRINFKTLEDQSHTEVRTFQSNLYALMRKDLEIRAKKLQIRFAEKETADWNSEPGFNNESGRQKPDQLARDLKQLRLDLSVLQKQRGNLDDALRGQLINTSSDIAQRGSLHPRPPAVHLDRATLEMLANLRLPDDQEDLKPISLPAENGLRTGLQSHLNGHPRVSTIPSDVLDPVFLSLGLDELWKVPGDDSSVFEKPTASNPRKTIDMNQLVSILPDNDAVFGKQLADGSWDEDAKAIPAIASYLFQQDLMKQANNLVDLDKKSTFSMGLRLNISQLLPVRLELNGARVTDSTQIDMKEMSNAILEKQIPVLIDNYRKRVALKAWEGLRQTQLQGLRDIRTLARDLIKQLYALDERLNVSKPRGTERSRRAEPFQTPFQDIALDRENLIKEIVSLQGVLDEAYLLTPRGSQEMSATLAAHFARSMKSAEMLVPPAPPEAPAPTPKPTKKAAHHSFAMLAMAWPTLSQYWSNHWLQGLTALALGAATILWAAYRHEQEVDGKSHLLAHLTGAVLTGLALQNWGMGVPVAILVFVIAQYTLPKRFFSKLKGSLIYRVTHWQNIHPTSVRILMRLALAWLVLTGIWMSVPFIKYQYHRQVASFSLESNAALRVGSQISTRPIYIGAPPGESGSAKNNPTYTSQNSFKAGQVVAAWRGPRDAKLADQFHDINARMESLGLKDAVQALDELETDTPQSRYQSAMIRIDSFGKEGSLEARLDWIASEMEKLLPLYANAKAEAEVNRARDDEAWQVSAYRNELRLLSHAATTVLQQRQWRDLVALKDFRLIPNSDRIVASKTVDSGHPISVGQQWIDHTGQFTFIFSLPETATFEMLMHEPNAFMLLEDAETNDKLVIRSQNIWEVREGLDKGLLSELFKNPGSGAIPEYRLVLQIHLRDELPPGNRNYILKGFYHAMKAKDEKNPPDQLRFIPPELKPTTHLALASVIPDGVTYTGFEGPGNALQEEKQAYRSALNNYVSEHEKWEEVYQRNKNKGSTAGVFFADQALKAIDQSNARIQELKRASEIAEDQIAAWQSSGLTHSAALPTGQRVFPANVIASDANPLDYHFRVVPPTDQLESDSQALYVLGPQTRIKIRLHANHYRELAVRPGETLVLSIPGSTQEYPASFVTVTQQDIREREMAASYFVLELNVPSSLVDTIYPQLHAGGSPTREAILEIHRASAIPAQKTAPSPISQAVPPAPSARWPGFLGRLAALFLLAPTAVFANSLRDLVGVHFAPWAAYLLVIAVVSGGILAAWFAGGGIRKIRELLMKHNQPVRVDEEPQPGISLDQKTTSLNGEFSRSEKLQRIGSEIQDLFGSKQISQETISLDSLEHRLAGWSSTEQRDHIAYALARSLHRIHDDSLIEKLGLLLKVPIQKSTKRSSDDLKQSILKSLEERLTQMDLVGAYTRPRDSLADVITTNQNKLVVIDTPFLYALSHMAVHGTADQQRLAEDLSLLLFTYLLAAPDRLESSTAKNISQYSIDETRAANFLSTVDELLKYLGLSSDITPFMKGFRIERNKRKHAISITVASQPPLGLPGLKKLLDYLQKQPLSFERVDVDGAPLSIARQLERDFKTKDVSPRLAKRLAHYYTVRSRVRDWSNARVSFALVEVIMLLTFLSFQIFWPIYLPDVFRKLLLSNLNLEMFLHAPAVLGVPPVVTILFVILMVAALFLSMFKSSAEFITANAYNALSFGFNLLHGRPTKYLDEFNRLTGLDIFNVFDAMKRSHPLRNGQEGEFRTLFQRHAAMITNRVYRTLTNRSRAPDDIFTLKRSVTAALYAYAEHPLHPDESFFNDFPKLQLPTDFEIFKGLGSRVEVNNQGLSVLFEDANQKYLYGIEADMNLPNLTLDDMQRFDAEEQWALIQSLRRQGFLNDDARRKEMEHRKVELAMAALLDEKNAVPAYLALMSRNLLGLAFDPSLNDPTQLDQTEMLREVTKASVDRMSRMAPHLYDSYAKYSRFAYMGFPIEYAIRDAYQLKPRHAADIEQAFEPVLSEIEIDASLPDMQPFLNDAQRTRMATFNKWVDRLNKWILLDKWGSGLLTAFKRQKFNGQSILSTIDYPVDSLALYLMLKHADPSDQPLEQRHYLNKAADALGKIFARTLRNKSVLNVNEVYESREFTLFRKLADQNRATAIANHEQDLNVYDLRRYMHLYLLAQTPSAKHAILVECLSHFQLTEGLINGFVFQQSRRLLKTDKEAYAQFARRVAGDNLTDPTLYPSYLLVRFLQDENLEARTEFASFVLVEDVASAVKQSIIDSIPAHGPKPFGRREIVQEAALDLNHRQAMIDMQSDAAMTDGDVNRVAVSRSLIPFMKEIFHRIPSRILNSAAKHLHPVHLEQIRSQLRAPADHLREIFISPEVLSQQKLVDDKKIQDSDLIGVPNPFYMTAFEILAWQSPLMTPERNDFLAAVQKERGLPAVHSILADLDALNYLVRSTGVKIKYINDRYKDGVDALEHLRPPESFDTGWIIPAPYKGQRSGSQKTAPPSVRSAA